MDLPVPADRTFRENFSVDRLSATPDQLASLGSFVSREWGDYGYRIAGLSSFGTHVAVALVRCSDGGFFMVATDRWGNSRHLSDDGRVMVAELQAMSEHATTV